MYARGNRFIKKTFSVKEASSAQARVLAIIIHSAIADGNLLM
jgi:hypothetical protein